MAWPLDATLVGQESRALLFLLSAMSWVLAHNAGSGPPLFHRTQGLSTVLSSQMLWMNKESRCPVNILVITAASPASGPQVRPPEVQEG